MRQAPTENRASQPRDFVHLRREATSGIEAVTARFLGHAYDMHHHDEWLVGVTHEGIQDFYCRGARRQSSPGRVILIEPGERHDGQAVREPGFRYSMLYLPQDWLRCRMGGSDAGIGFRRTLADDRAFGGAIHRACRAVFGATSPLETDAALDDLAGHLRRHLGAAGSGPSPDGGPEVAERAMDFMRAHAATAFGLDALAQAAGAADRFQLARAFRRRFGTSPHACLVEIRLARARALLRAGTPPADAALEAGFSDQSHLGRWFRRAYGLTPAVYRSGRTNVPDAALAVG
ncbi:AraC family transcriptional regulator [Methylobacterium frigidaeris]|uniref:HTH-type transcriptional activator RhaS n=1 Tax=Methylobacterium frigidaeris TaxID=2038277 RepID=A0AA37M4L0_9HYPH|nr:AraC family transcriptional regulator [Methylobacterium frigidaeris]PIK70146.1 AraC family transcriptional regulator [Methylobacterium frigidaeris]GJD62229.1 HTH-type transcriptional activator RhaS [Methylobacterium frigidaeris]